MENQAFDRWVASKYEGEALAPPVGLEAAVFARLDAEGGGDLQGRLDLRRWGVVGLLLLAGWGGWWWGIAERGAGSEAPVAPERTLETGGQALPAEAAAVMSTQALVEGTTQEVGTAEAGTQVATEGRRGRGEQRRATSALSDEQVGPVAPCEPVVPLDVVPFARVVGGKDLVYPNPENELIALPATITVRQ